MSDLITVWKGQLVKCSGVFTIDGAEADPDVVKVTITNPSGESTTYTYGTDAELVKASTGNYSVNVDADEAGTWYYRFWSTGDGQASEQSNFEVREVAGG